MTVRADPPVGPVPVAADGPDGFDASPANDLDGPPTTDVVLLPHPRTTISASPSRRFMFESGAIPDVIELLPALDAALAGGPTLPAGAAVTDPALPAGMGPGPDTFPGPRPGGFTSLLGSAVGAFLTTLIVGAILMAVVPDYTRARMSEALDEPIVAFLYGVAALIALFVAIVVFVVTLIGIPIAILLAVVAYVLWAVGASIAFLAIGDRLVGDGSGWTTPLLVGAAINGGLTLTGIGGILTFAVGATGFGTVLRAYL